MQIFRDFSLLKIKNYCFYLRWDNFTFLVEIFSSQLSSQEIYTYILFYTFTLQPTHLMVSGIHFKESMIQIIILFINNLLFMLLYLCEYLCYLLRYFFYYLFLFNSTHHCLSLFPFSQLLSLIPTLFNIDTVCIPFYHLAVIKKLILRCATLFFNLCWQVVQINNLRQPTSRQSSYRTKSPKMKV